MPDFPIPLKIISCGNGIARLATMGGHEFSASSHVFPQLAGSSGIIELPLGTICENMDSSAQQDLKKALIGCPED